MATGWALLHVFAWPAGAPSVAGFVTIPAVLCALSTQGAYRSAAKPVITSGLASLRAIGVALLPGVALTLLLCAALGFGDALEAPAVLALVLPALLLVPAVRGTTLYLAGAAPRRAERVLIFGSGRVAKSVAERLGRSSKTEVIGMVDDHPLDPGDVVGRIEDLPRLCRALEVDRVLVAFSQTPSHHVVRMLQEMGSSVAISIVPRMYEVLGWRSTIEDLHGLPLLSVAPAQNSRVGLAAKRAIDLVGAALGLLLLAPLLLVIAGLVKLTSPGPLIFRQERLGLKGQPFTILKFRTMEPDAEVRRSSLQGLNEVDGPIFKMRRDPRVTRLGSLLRRYSLDELPQLINVLRGDMSLVGPRPFCTAETQGMSDWASTRGRMRPGMTGLWQVSGRNELSYDDLRHLDSAYVWSWSLWWDLRILLQTPACLMHRRGAF